MTASTTTEYTTGPALRRPLGRHSGYSFGQFANTFSLFALGILAGLWLPEKEPNLDRYRTLFTIRVANVLVIPAFCLFLFRNRSAIVNNYWLLFWTFSYFAFMIHFFWAFHFIFHDNIHELIDTMSLKIAGPNFLLAGWWGLDVLLDWTAWITNYDPKILRGERWLAHSYAFMVFIVTDFFLKTGVVRYIGLALALASGISFAAWLIDRRHAKAVEPISNGV